MTAQDRNRVFHRSKLARRAHQDADTRTDKDRKIQAGNMSACRKSAQNAGVKYARRRAIAVRIGAAARLGKKFPASQKRVAEAARLHHPAEHTRYAQLLPKCGGGPDHGPQETRQVHIDKCRAYQPSKFSLHHPQLVATGEGIPKAVRRSTWVCSSSKVPRHPKPDIDHTQYKLLPSH